MTIIKIKGRGAVPGIADGVALVCPDSIAGNSGALGDTDGIIYEKSNVNRGVSIENRILVVPCSKGSNGFSAHVKSAFVCGVRPAGWVVTRIDAKIGVALASLGLPAVVDFNDVDPIDIIKTGDTVRIDGTSGDVEIITKNAELAKAEDKG